MGTEENRCEVCGTRTRNRYWHSTGSDLVDRAACRAAGGGPGVWLCTICEEGTHKWMKENPGIIHAAQKAVDEMSRRLATAIFVPRRTRRRKTETN